MGRYRIDGVVKNSIGNGIAGELTCMTRGHDLGGRVVLLEGVRGTGWRRAKGEN